MTSTLENNHIGFLVIRNTIKKLTNSNERPMDNIPLLISNGNNNKVCFMDIFLWIIDGVYKKNH